MTWRPIRDQSAVRENAKLLGDNCEGVISFPSDEFLAQVEDSELSKFVCFSLNAKADSVLSRKPFPIK